MKTLVLYLLAVSLFGGMFGKTINHFVAKFSGEYAIPERLSFQLFVFLLPAAYFTKQVLQENTYDPLIVFIFGVGLSAVCAIITYLLERKQRISVVQTDASYGRDQARKQSADFVRTLLNILTLSFLASLLVFHFILGTEWSVALLYSFGISIGIFLVIN